MTLFSCFSLQKMTLFVYLLFATANGLFQFKGEPRQGHKFMSAILICRLPLLSLGINIYQLCKKSTFFPSNLIEHLSTQPVWLTLCQWRPEKGWLTMMYDILLPHCSPLFMMLLMPTTRHKTAAPTVVCSQVQALVFKRQWKAAVPRSCSSPVDGGCSASLVLVPFNLYRH